MPITPAKAKKQPDSITPAFPRDTPEETILVEISGWWSEAVTSALRLSNDGRLSPSAQAAFWSLGQSALLSCTRIDDLWYEILAVIKPGELNRYLEIAKAAAEICATAKLQPTPESVSRAYEALGAANDVLASLLDRSAA